jgi:hypothetical protein
MISLVQLSFDFVLPLRNSSHFYCISSVLRKGYTSAHPSTLNESLALPKPAEWSRVSAIAMRHRVTRRGLLVIQPGYIGSVKFL